MVDNNKLYDIVKDSIEEKLKDAFNRGLMAGWDACLKATYKQVNELTSAKAIKAFLKNKIDEVNNRAKKVSNEE